MEKLEPKYTAGGKVNGAVITGNSLTVSYVS